MNEVLEKAAAESIAKVTEYLTRGADFAIQQVPDVAREVILWGRVKCVVEMIAAVSLALVARWGIAEAVRINAEKGTGTAYLNDEEIVPFISGVCAAFIAALFFGDALSNVRAWVVPKLYLISTIAGMGGK